MSCESGISLLSANNWSLAVSLVTIIVAIIAISVAVWQLHVGRTETRSAQAHETYQQYLARCIEYSEFASGYTAKSKPDPEYDKYKWFVSSMLFSFEQILEAKPKDQYWINAICSQLKLHEAHLVKSSTIDKGEWHDSLQRLLNSTVSNAGKKA